MNRGTGWSGVWPPNVRSEVRPPAAMTSGAEHSTAAHTDSQMHRDVAEPLLHHGQEGGGSGNTGAGGTGKPRARATEAASW